MNIQKVSSSNRLHIGFFGKTNSGKSSIINAICRQDVSIVSDVKGTTTDIVTRPIEIKPMGPCVLLDTAGFDDETELREKRLEKTNLALKKTDVAILVVSSTDEITADSLEIEWYSQMKKTNTPVVFVINKMDIAKEKALLLQKGIKSLTGLDAILVSAYDNSTILELEQAIAKVVPEEEEDYITSSLVDKDDVVLLVMPQDSEAPKKRLILPQMETLRELLDRKCIVLSIVPESMESTLKALKSSPKLIITDSQVFAEVYKKKPKDSKLTSFSILFARYRGDIEYYLKSVEAVEHLNSKSRILIAECCTHAPLTEDIGRVKIPALLKKKLGDTITVDIVAGTKYPSDLTPYDLIIQCGGCMFNKKYIQERIQQAKEQNVPMTNYGVFIANHLNILDKVDF